MQCPIPGSQVMSTVAAAFFEWGNSARQLTFACSTSTPNFVASSQRSLMRNAPTRRPACRSSGSNDVASPQVPGCPSPWAWSRARGPPNHIAPPFTHRWGDRIRGHRRSSARQITASRTWSSWGSCRREEFKCHAASDAPPGCCVRRTPPSSCICPCSSDDGERGGARGSIAGRRR